ncbi:hypothetical protein GTA07_29630 [Rhodococcus hoagii]|nr:hypothetical protein [Prescottella equi]
MHTRLDDTLTRQLLQQAPAAYRTRSTPAADRADPRDLRWDRAVFGADPARRAQAVKTCSDVDLTRTVGWFTSAFPVRLDDAGDVTDAIKTRQAALRAIPERARLRCLALWAAPSRRQP